MATLPGNLEFESTDASAEVTSEGGEITFDPIKTMSAGDREEHTGTGKPNGNGDVRPDAVSIGEMRIREVIGEELMCLYKTSNN